MASQPWTAAPEIPGYRVRRLLGEGGMGRVWLADELSLARRVAIKTISTTAVAEGHARSRFLREARVMATVEHPNVVRVYAWGDAASLAYFVMEYVEGGTLSSLLRRAGRLDPDDALRITRQVALALAAAWRRQVVHRDVKPSNVLFDGDGAVRVADFGLARPVTPTGDPSLTCPGAMVGSPHYMSPEQAKGTDLDFRSDIYSLGVVLFEMLAGGRPFDGGTPAEVIAHQLHDPLPTLRERRPDLPPSLGTLVETMTAKDPERRPASYRALLEKIEESRPGSGRDPALTSSPTLTEWSTTRGRGGRRGFLGGMGALVLAVGAGGVWWRARGPSPAAGPSLAIAPFYGPDEASAREGRLLAALLEAEIGRRKGDRLHVKGAEEAGTPVRTEAAARARARELGVQAVVWGQVLALATHVEAQPWFTSATESRPLSELAIESANSPGALERRRAAAVSLADAVVAAVDVESAPSPRADPVDAR